MSASVRIGTPPVHASDCSTTSISFRSSTCSKHPKHQHGDGCLSDQLFGQGWAHQVGLGYILPAGERPRRHWSRSGNTTGLPISRPEQGTSAAAVVRLSRARPDCSPALGPRASTWAPNRCLYRDEIWTGIEYQVAGNMAWEGMITEALAICRGVHDRYHPAKHNPWNEIECGDHYARGMASWGVLIGLCPASSTTGPNSASASPRASHRSSSAAPSRPPKGGALWLRVEQANKQLNQIDLRWGTLPVRVLTTEIPEGRGVRAWEVRMGDQKLIAEIKQSGPRVEIALAQTAIIQEGQKLTVELLM